MKKIILTIWALLLLLPLSAHAELFHYTGNSGVSEIAFSKEIITPEGIILHVNIHASGPSILVQLKQSEQYHYRGLSGWIKVQKLSFKSRAKVSYTSPNAEVFPKLRESWDNEGSLRVQNMLFYAKSPRFLRLMKEGHPTTLIITAKHWNSEIAFPIRLDENDVKEIQQVLFQA